MRAENAAVTLLGCKEVQESAGLTAPLAQVLGSSLGRGTAGSSTPAGGGCSLGCVSQMWIPPSGAEGLGSAGKAGWEAGSGGVSLLCIIARF